MSFYIEDINISVILSYSLQKLISNKTCDSDIHMMSILLDWVNLVASDSYTEHFIAHYLWTSTMYWGLTKQTFPPCGYQDTDITRMEFISQIKYNVIQISQPTKSQNYLFIFLFRGLWAFYQECSFPDVWIFYSLTVFKYLCSKFSSFKVFLTTKLKKYASDLSSL